jgi:RNA polymerase sigma-70 factor (sigma-E family)
MRGVDREQFTMFASSRMSSLLRLAYLMCQDHDAAQDVVQVALVKLYRAWAKVQRADNPDAYARRVVVNAALDFGRRRRDIPVANVADRAAVRSETDTIDQALDLRRYLAGLPPKQRAVIVLRYYADLSETDIADALGISTGTVKSHAARGLAALRVYLNETAPMEAPPCI